MAEPAQSPATTVTISPTGREIKQEATGFEGLGLSMSPEIATKRPMERNDHDGDAPEPKRVKTEIEVEAEPEQEPEEGSVEDGLALLIQNTLANINDLVGHANDDLDASAGANDPMDIESMPPPEPTPAPPPPVTFALDPEAYIRHTNMHALGSLAISFLIIISQRPIDEPNKWLREDDSEHARSLRRLRLAFDATRDLYSTDPVLVSDPLETLDADFRTTHELANLAKLGTWIIDGNLESLATADANFLSVFPAQLSELPLAVSELFLAIKTQRAVEALMAKGPDTGSEEVIAEALINDLEDRLRGRLGGQELTAADQTFVASVRLRQGALREDTQTQIDQLSLSAKYPPTDLLRLFSRCVKDRLALATSLGEKLGVAIPISDDVAEVEAEPVPEDNGDDMMLDLDDLSSFFEKTTSGLVQNALAGLTEEEPTPAPTIEGEEAPVEVMDSTPKADDPSPHTNGKVDFMTDYKELEALVAESTADYVKTTLNGLSPVPYQPTVPASTAESMAAQGPYLSHLQQQQPNAYYSYSQPPQEHPVQQPGPGGILPPNQSLSSALLYDKARQAALSKSSAHTRREGLHSTRRPWTQEEEKALMAGLDMVKGPHWSQILTLFGQNGTISDILKERTQVQLKDKARNLKLFFLKTNSEMPYYLQAVTGELKTRAPTQAARKEAEERARMTSEEDQAKLQGIMALAGGLQHPPQNRTSGSPANTGSSHGVTASQAVSRVPQSGQSATTLQNAPTAAHTQATTSSGALAASGLPRTVSQVAAQHALQSMPQAPPRPQNQLPPHIPRPQTQQHHQQPQHTSSTQHVSHQQPHHSQTHTSATTSMPQATPATQSAQPKTPTATPAQQQQQQPQPRPSPSSHSHPSAPAGSAVKQAQPAQANHLPPPQVPQAATQSHDNSAEAALLKGLQAVVAETTS